MVLDYTIGIKGLWNSNFGYHKVKLRIDDRFRINPLGFTDYAVEVGKIWGPAPWPFLFNHNGNTSYMSDKTAFNLMRNLELLAINTLPYLFNIISMVSFSIKFPEIKKLKLREVVTFNALYSSLVNYDSHKQLLAFPQYQTSNKPALYQPYYEDKIWN